LVVLSSSSHLICFFVLINKFEVWAFRKSSSGIVGVNTLCLASIQTNQILFEVVWTVEGYDMERQEPAFSSMALRVCTARSDQPM